MATLWVVSVGGEADARQPVSGLDALPELHIARRKATKRSQPRMQSCFARGLQRIWVVLLDGRLLLVRPFFPEPWPATLPPRKPPTKQRSPKPPLTTLPVNASPSPLEAVLC